jgi:hypothetical protein
MGAFKLQPKLYQVTFEDGDLDGLVCKFKGLSLEEYIAFVTLAESVTTPEGRTPENIEKQFVTLAELLVSWNLEDDDDQPVEPSYEALKKFDLTLVRQIMRGYTRAFTSVPKASNETSPSGETSPERSLGLARQSRSQAS